MEAKNIKNVYLYPNDSLVVFNFNTASQLSQVLNTLTDLGYPEKGDSLTSNKYNTPYCTCINNN